MPTLPDTGLTPPDADDGTERGRPCADPHSSAPPDPSPPPHPPRRVTWYMAGERVRRRARGYPGSALAIRLRDEAGRQEALDKKLRIRRYRFDIPLGAVNFHLRGTAPEPGWGSEELLLDVSDRSYDGSSFCHPLVGWPHALRGPAMTLYLAAAESASDDTIYEIAETLGLSHEACSAIYDPPDASAPRGPPDGTHDHGALYHNLCRAAQRVANGESVTIVDTLPLESSVGAAVSEFLTKRAQALRADDDAVAARDMLHASQSRLAATPAQGQLYSAHSVRTMCATDALSAPHQDDPPSASPETTPSPHAPPPAAAATAPDPAAAPTALPRPPAPLVNVSDAAAPGERRIVLVAVTHNRGSTERGARFLAHMPPDRDALHGTTEHADTRRRRREAQGEETERWLDLGCPKEAYFHAGDVQTHLTAHPDHPNDDPLAPSAKRTIVFTALLVQLPADAALAPTAQPHPSGSAHGGPAADGGTWWTLDQLTADATHPAGLARYRAAATAIAKIDSYMQPTAAAPHFMRWGVRHEMGANLSATTHETAAIQLQRRLVDATAEAAKLQRLLEEVTPTGDGEDDGFAAFAHGLAPHVDCSPGGSLPPELIGYTLPDPPPDARRRPFRHTAVIYPTKPLPAPAAQTPPADGWWPHDVHDIVEEWALEEIDAWLQACIKWHREGGPGHSRPNAIALGRDAIKPLAFGRLWDLRGGPGNVKLFDPTTEPKRTGLNLEFAASEFHDLPDGELVSMIIHGVRMQTEGMAHQIVLMPNLLSMYSENGGVGAAADQMAGMQKHGFLELFGSLPCVPFRAMPRGVVPKKDTDELRGIGDQGQPRKPLRTRRSGEPVASLNGLSREGDWSHQDMDSLETAAHNSAVLQVLGDLNNEATVDMAFDFSKFFHQLFYDALLLWQMGAIVPRKRDPASHTAGADDALDFALEYVMTMGATPSSQVAQRFSNAITLAVYRRMHAMEAARWQDPDLPNELTAPARAALEQRAQLQPSCYGTHAALFNLLIYCDDARMACVGAARAVRLLRAFYEVVGVRGLRLPLSRAEKQQTGFGVVWLGAHLSTSLGLIWVPKDKAAKAATALHTALAGKLQVGDYRRLLGFLVSLLFMMGGDKRLLHHIFRPVKPGEELDHGPATLVYVDELMRPTLERWLGLIMDVPGAAMLSAFAPTPPPSTTPRHRIRADAALEGTNNPGLGGWLYGHWFAVAIADHPGLELLDIPHLEFLAAGISIITFAQLLTGASLVCIETDALATASSLTRRAFTPIMQAILDALLEAHEYTDLAPRLLVAHCSGAGNPMADAASRGYSSTLAALSEALGVTSTQIPISEGARQFMQRALDSIRPIIAARPHTASQPSTLGTEGDAPPAPEVDPYGHEVIQYTGPRPASGGRAAAPPKRVVLVPETPPPTPPERRSSATPRVSPPQPSPPSHARRGAARTPPSKRSSPPKPKRGRMRHSPAASAPVAAATHDAPLRRLFTAPTQPAPASHSRAGHRLPAVPDGKENELAAPPSRRGPGGANMHALLAAREDLTDVIYDLLRNDTSEHAIRADDETIRWLADISAQGDPDQAPVTTQAQRASNWKHWAAYTSHLKLSSPWRPDVNTLDACGHRRESAIWAGALMWIYARMKPRKGKFLPEGAPHFGKPKPPSPLSALAVLRGVRAEHMARGIQPPPLTLAAKRAHEQMLKYAREIGPENCVPERAIPMSHELICRILTIPDGHEILKGGRPWRWTTTYGLSVRTVFHVLSQCGFRKAEVALGAGKWGSDKMSFASLKWIIGGETVLHPTVDQLRHLKRGDYAILMPGPSKADCFGMKWGNNPIWLPFDPEAAINAAGALAQWEIHAGVKPENRRTTPLFCGPEGVGTPLRAAALDEIFFRMMSYVLGDAAVAKKYSIHGFRSYLASALMAAGCSGPEIQAALRWASVEALQIYEVVQRETYGDWLIRAETVKLTGARASSLHAEGKHLPVYEPEHMIADVLATREEMRGRAERADSIDVNLIRNMGVDGIVADTD